jgi:hypothetical protein
MNTLTLTDNEVETLRNALYTARATYHDLADNQRMHDNVRLADQFDAQSKTLDTLIARLDEV